MQCTTCGGPLPEGANYCPKCGRLVQTAAPAERSGMPRWLLGVLIGGALLLVSVPFLGILAAILIPNFLHARAEAFTARDQGNEKMIATALEGYAVDHGGRYPDNLTQVVPKYLKALPTVPGGDGAAYAYQHPASTPAHGAYEIWDDGSMDPTTLTRIPQGVGGASCVDCKYVVYAATGGIIGVPGTH